MNKSSLHIAAWEGNLEMVIYHIENGVSVNNCDEYNSMALHYAVERNHLEILKYLIHKNCHLDVKDINHLTPLLIAVCRKNVDMVQLLLKAGADLTCFDDDKWTALHYASSSNSAELLELILQTRKLNVNAKTTEDATPLALAAYEGHKEAVDVLLKFGASVDCVDENGWTFFHHASSNGWTDTVQRIVKREKLDIDVMVHDMTPLMMAAKWGVRNMVELLLSLGANHAICSEEEKWTAFHHAACSGWTDIVQLLYDCFPGQLDVDLATCRGASSLLLAAERGHLDMVQLLLRLGADITLCDDDGSTALHRAAEVGYIDVVRHILENGLLSVNVRDKKKQTPFNLVDKISVRLELLRLLIQHGAYIESSDYADISKDSELKEILLKDVHLCSQSIINKYNNRCLPAVYGLFEHAFKLPCIEMLKLRRAQNASRNVVEFVKEEIHSKSLCNVAEMHPPVLKLMSVRSLLNYYSK